MGTQVATTTRKEAAAQVYDEIQRRRPELVAMLPREVSLEEFQRVTLNAIQGNPELLECTSKSLFDCITRAAREGWVPDGRECYFSVRKNTKTGEKTVAFIPGVHGYLKNTIGITLDDWRGGVVREGDDYEVELGDDERFVLRVDPFLRDDDRPIIGAYSIAMLPGAKRPSRQFMNMKALLAAKAKSPSAHSPHSPWNTNFEDMCIKTAMKKHANRLPVGKKTAELLAEERDFDSEAARAIETPAQPAQARKGRTPTQLLEAAGRQEGAGEEDRRPPEPKPAQRAAAREEPRPSPTSTTERTSGHAQSAVGKSAGAADATPGGSSPRHGSATNAARRPDEDGREEEQQPAPPPRGRGRPSAAQLAAEAAAARGKPKAAPEPDPEPDFDDQTDIEDDPDVAGSDANEETDPTELARLAGESAYEAGNPRKAPREYLTGNRFAELDAFYEGWDNMKEGDRMAGQAMS